MYETEDKLVSLQQVPRRPTIIVYCFHSCHFFRCDQRERGNGKDPRITKPSVGMTLVELPLQGHPQPNKHIGVVLVAGPVPRMPHPKNVAFNSACSRFLVELGAYSRVSADLRAVRNTPYSSA